MYNAGMKKKTDQVRRRVFEIIQIGNRGDFISHGFDIFIAAVILINITVMFLETFSSLEPWMDILEALETVTILIFCVEYGLRIWTADYLYPGKTKKEAVCAFLLSYDGIVDLLTILPFFFLSGFVAFRMLRVVRIFHLFRINASYDSFNVICSVLKEKKNQIAFSLFILLILIMASSLCMYSAEHEAQPEAFKNALSGIWWSVSALLTVGYGDIYPVTVMGKAMAIVISILGVMVVAIPTGIISAGFVENYTEAMNSSAALDFDLIKMIIGPDSRWTGKRIDEIHSETGYAVVLVRRNGKTVLPENEYRIETGDELAVYKETDNG